MHYVAPGGLDYPDAEPLVGWGSWWSVLAAIICIPVILIGLYDWLHPDSNVARNYPVAAHIRWLFYDLCLFLCQYIVEGDQEGTSYSFEAREQTSRPYCASIFNISVMSFGVLSENAVEALNLGARQGGFLSRYW